MEFPECDNCGDPLEREDEPEPVRAGAPDRGRDERADCDGDGPSTDLPPPRGRPKPRAGGEVILTVVVDGHVVATYHPAYPNLIIGDTDKPYPPNVAGWEIRIWRGPLELCQPPSGSWTLTSDPTNRVGISFPAAYDDVHVLMGTMDSLPSDDQVRDFVLWRIEQCRKAGLDKVNSAPAAT
jgi:hypothetical protein